MPILPVRHAQKSDVSPRYHKLLRRRRYLFGERHTAPQPSTFHTDVTRFASPNRSGRRINLVFVQELLSVTVSTM